jgi:predicted nucleotidyltransferase
MTNFKEILKTPEYDFLKTNPHLGKNIILLSIGGSHAYGTNVAGSDVDIRGVALNSKAEILGSANFEQVVNEATDTTVYSLRKIVSLLTSCNPNTIELLGLRPEHYLYLSSIGQELLDNKKLFLSKRAKYSFGGYAFAQLRRLDNKAARTIAQADREQHILNSITAATYVWPDKYGCFKTGEGIKLYLDNSEQEDMDKEIYMDIFLTHYPLRDYKAMWADMKNIISDYDKIGHRNQNAIERGKLGKHMMHLVRLYLMCLDILEKEEINTYRENDIPFLLDIRNGKFLDKDSQPLPEFYEMVSEYEKRLEYAVENTSLPEKPDYDAINEFLMSVNERVVKDFNLKEKIK